MIRPAGSFVVRPKPEADPNAAANTSTEATTVEASEGMSQDGDEDAQPNFNQQGGKQRNPQPKIDTEGMDEDQLAYLRAQAAQDAAIASLSQDGAGPKSLAPNRGRHPNQNNNRNRHGRHDGAPGSGQNRNQNQNNRNRNGGGGGQNRNQKYRPRPMGGEPGNAIQAAQQEQSPAQVSVPDYEVISKPSDDGSNS